MMPPMHHAMAAALLVVAACGDPTVTITVDELDGSTAVAVAYQDGDGPWRAVEGDGRYSFDISSGRYGVAAWCISTRARSVVFAYLTTDELEELTISAGCPVPSVTLTGRVFNLADNAQISWANAAVTADGAGFYQLMGPAGTHDLVGAGYRLVGAGRTVDALVIDRDREIGGNQAVDVDLNEDSIELDDHELNVDGRLPDDFASATSALFTAGRTTAALGTTSGSGLTFQAVPAAALVDGDHQAVTVQVTGPAVAGAPQRLRTHTAHVEVATDLDVTLLDATDPPEASDGPRFTWTRVDGADAYHLAIAQTDGSGAAHEYTGAWSAAYLGDDIVLDLPDLSDVDDWDDRVDLVPNATIFWTVSARTSNASLARLIGVPAPGTSISTTGWFGSLAP